MNFLEWFSMGCAGLIIIATMCGAPTHERDVYVWMATLMLWILIASRRRRGEWR